MFFCRMCARGNFTAYRVSGPYEPERGLRFNSSKLLIDPYAKAIAGQVNWADEMFGYVVGDEKEDLVRDFRDNAWGMPKAVVIDNAFDWGDDKRLGIPLHSSVIYEMHVKGFTKLCPGRAGGIARNIRGSRQRGARSNISKILASPRSSCCRSTRIIDDKILVDRGLTNYWGYNTIGFFAPEAKYSSSGDHGRTGD